MSESPKSIKTKAIIATRADGYPKIQVGTPGAAHTVTFDIYGVSIDDLLSFCNQELDLVLTKTGVSYGKQEEEFSED